MPTSKISVVIPTRLRDESLKQCLAALAPGVQTLNSNSFEIIVSDDGHSPRTKEMLETTFPFANYICGPRRGPAANRNCGARHAQNPFIAFIDDDCIPAQQWLAAFAEAASESIALYEGKTTCNAGLHTPMQEAPINLEGGCFWSCNLMVCAATFWTLHGFDEDFPFASMEDIAFRDMVARAGAKRVFVPGAVVDHPPRATPYGWKRAFSHESFVIFWEKFPEFRRSTFKHMSVIWRVRMRTIGMYPLSRDSVRAFNSAILEQWLILWKLHGWLRRYHRKLTPSTRINQASD